MSRGLGRQEQRILASLSDHDAVYVGNLNESGSRSEANSLNRAAYRLFRMGLLDIVRYWAGRRRTLVTRKGVAITEGPPGYYRQKNMCWMRPESWPFQHLHDPDGDVSGEVLPATQRGERYGARRVTGRLDA